MKKQLSMVLAAALTHLSCSRNQLSSLDVSKNTALTELYCSLGVTVTGCDESIIEYYTSD